MARYNHFAPLEYERISFKHINIGDEFRVCRIKNSRHSYLICVKTSDFDYKEKKSGKIHTPAIPFELKVYSRNKVNQSSESNNK